MAFTAVSVNNSFLQKRTEKLHFSAVHFANDDFQEGIQDVREWPKVVQGSRGILPHKMFKIEVLGNGISGILRSSEYVTKFHCFNSGGSLEPPQTLLDPPQIFIVCSQHNGIPQTNTKGVCRVSCEKLEYKLSFEIRENQFHLFNGKRTPQERFI